MAQLLLISNKTYGENINEIGDIVGIWEDAHQFTSHEEDMFDIMPIPGFTRAELETELRKLIPKTQDIYKSKTTEWTNDVPDKKEAWLKDTGWHFIKERDKYLFSVQGLKPAIRATLKDPVIEIETKKLLIANNIKETISRSPQNHDKVPGIVII